MQMVTSISEVISEGVISYFGILVGIPIVDSNIGLKCDLQNLLVFQ